MTEQKPNVFTPVGQSDFDQANGTKISALVQWLVVIGGTIVAGAFVIGVAVTMTFDPRLFELALKQLPATFGLPLAALASLAIVICLRTTNGPIEFEVIGFKFKGASGPIIMWVLCFLAIAAAIKLLWIS
jgi:hypothetical protein